MSAGRRAPRLPKPFLPLGGEPMVLRALRALAAARPAETILVLPPAFIAETVRRWGRALRRAGVTAIVPGGARRQDSVAAGLAALGPSCRWVMIHDAARPLVPPAVVDAVGRTARRVGAAIVAVPCEDSLKRVGGKRGKGRGDRGQYVVERTIPREGVWRVQTPQVFRRDLIERAYARAGRQGVTDDCALVEALGAPVAVVPGSPFNLKITTPDDLEVARALIPFAPGARRKAGKKA
jgi:2-C-methyl-D-erythritol 4-phosphate cytidylyltransferase